MTKIYSQMNKEEKKRHNEKVKAYADKCKREHRCTACGKPLILDYPFVRCAKCRKRINRLSKRRIVERKKIVVDHYGGGVCECCGESNIKFLTIDHVDGGGTKKRLDHKMFGSGFYRILIKEGFPKGLRILCYNCNCGRQTNGGICPHKEEHHDEDVGRANG
jgi:hypothetical protein